MDPLLKTLARRGAPTTLVAADATHVLTGRVALDLFLRNDSELRVRRGLTIAAMGANPWSTYGWHFKPGKLAHTLREVIDLPVVNVKEDWARNWSMNCGRTRGSSECWSAWVPCHPSANGPPAPSGGVASAKRPPWRRG